MINGELLQDWNFIGEKFIEEGYIKDKEGKLKYEVVKVGKKNIIQEVLMIDSEAGIEKTSLASTDYQHSDYLYHTLYL